MSWKDILKSRFQYDSDGKRLFSGPSYLEGSNAWESMENPREMRDFMEKTQQGSGVHFVLKDKTYVGLDKFITGLKRVSGKTKFNRGRYGVSNTMDNIVLAIMSQEDNLPQRQELWKLIQEHYADPETLRHTGGEGWTTDEKNIPSWR